MFMFRYPGAHHVRNFLNDQSILDLSYAQTGITRKRRAPGYTTDRYAVRLGEGAEVFARARKAVETWRMFKLDWVRLFWEFARIREYELVAVLALHGQFYTLNACRIVYVVEEVRRFGFAYGTLPDHMERGEELFLVEWRQDDSVWYEIVAMSRPRHWLAWLAYPYTRRTQQRFAQGSIEAMLAAVAGDAVQPAGSAGEGRLGTI